MLNEIHYLFVIGLLSIPFLPTKYVKKMWVYPLILVTIWLVCDGCPITLETHGKGKSFIHENIMKKIDPKLAEERTENIIRFVLLAIVVASAQRLINDCRSRCE